MWVGVVMYCHKIARLYKNEQQASYIAVFYIAISSRTLANGIYLFRIDNLERLISSGLNTIVISISNNFLYS